MKTHTKILAAYFALSSLGFQTLKAQWYGQHQYPHTNSVLSSAKRTVINPGYVMAGFTASRPVGSPDPDFVIDKVDVDGFFSGSTDFSVRYQIQIGVNCSLPVSTVRNCSGICIIETNNQGNNEAYALCGATERGLFFATLDQSGNVINKNYWSFTHDEVNPRTPVIRESSTPGEYFISGHFFLNAYVMRVDFNASQIWGNAYGTGLEPRDMIESTHNGELIVVGSSYHSGAAGTDPFFLSIDANTGSVNYCKYYNLNATDADDWFSCIEIANSPTGGRGYIVGGRSLEPTYNVPFTQFMTKLDVSGKTIWSSLIQPGASNPPYGSGDEIIRAMERKNPNSGSYEYYGVATSFYYHFGTSLIPRNNLVVFKLDDNGSNTLSLNEFHYTGGGCAPGVTGANTSHGDLAMIETNGGHDDGLQAFGSEPGTVGYHYFTKAYFNGVSGCKESHEKIDQIYQGPKDLGMLTITKTPITPCGPNYVNFIPVTPLGQITQLCHLNSDPNGSNVRAAATGLKEAQTANEQVRLYPNPVNHGMTISLPGAATVIIYNTLGQQIGNYSFNTENGGEFEIDFDALHVKAGFYSVQVNTQSATTNYKVMYEPK